MLTSIRIQNFRSIRDAQVKLGQVNLFIGPNNSGKSNFLKGIELLTNAIQAYPNGSPSKTDDFSNIITRSNNLVPAHNQFVRYSVSTSSVDSLYVACGYIGVPQISTNDFEPLTFQQQSASGLQKRQQISSELYNLIRLDAPNTFIFKPDPSKFEFGVPISWEHAILPDGKNIVSAVFHLAQNYRDKFDDFEHDFALCIKDLVKISTPLSGTDPNTFGLIFFDKKGLRYRAEEVSEGVLYFVALLCFIHQPNPPKLLLLEEPEKGIHPRRIREVIDFIFELARLRDIQIILTSHSPYVVDHFADIPECISVFDRENGETVIRNAADIIAETNAKLKEPIRYSDALGEHWVSGFLGGVPL